MKNDEHYIFVSTTFGYWSFRVHLNNDSNFLQEYYRSVSFFMNASKTNDFEATYLTHRRTMLTAGAHTKKTSVLSRGT